MTILSTPPFPASAAPVMNRDFAVRFVTPDDRVHEVECRDGRLTEWRQCRSSLSVPLLECYVPRLLDDEQWRALPFLEDPRLHGEVLVASGRDGSVLRRLFPLAITGSREPKEYLADFAMLWVLRDGPFGDFAWRLAFLDGRCEMNDTVAAEYTEGTPWDIVLEIDFVDCIDYFLGHFDVRELIAQGHVDGSVYALSALTWYVEHDEMLERAHEHLGHAELLRDWVRIVRSDTTLAWAEQRRAREESNLRPAD